MSIAAKRRETEVFSLAFLDCICCGFGAVILVFVLTVASKMKVDKTDVNELRERTQAMERDVALSQAEIDRLAKVLAAAQLELDDVNAKSTQDQLKLSSRQRELLLLLQQLLVGLSIPILLRVIPILYQAEHLAMLRVQQVVAIRSSMSAASVF